MIRGRAEGVNKEWLLISVAVATAAEARGEAGATRQGGCSHWRRARTCGCCVAVGVGLMATPGRPCALDALAAHALLISP